LLSDPELVELVAFYEPGAPEVALARWRALFAADQSGPLALINRFRLRERAEYDDGQTGTGIEALMRYAATSVPALAKVGGRFLVSSAALTPLFDTPSDTDLVVVGWYPDRAALLELLRDPEYRTAFEHRRAAVAEQWVVAAPAIPHAA
jgi:uncharacterized protein (DUF1330 family)